MTFDLQAAREITIKLTLRYPAKELIDVDYQNALAGEMLPGACEEIVRLDREVSVARNLAALAKGIVDEQAARIKQLEADKKNLRELFIIRGEIHAKHNRAVKEEHERELKAYSDKIKELKGWLVEERAFQIENNPNRTLEWAHSDAIDMAREQLQAEDKL